MRLLNESTDIFVFLANFVNCHVNFELLFQSDDDIQLQNELLMLLERLKESDQSLYLPALESMRTLIRTATTSMTSVPKPLKFLHPHYGVMKEVFEKIKDQKTKVSFILLNKY